MPTTTPAQPAPTRADLLVRNVSVVRGGVADDEYWIQDDAAIAIVGPELALIGPAADAPRTAERVIDGSGQVAFPGLISTHNHLFQNLCKGLGDEMALWPIVESVILATAEEMTPDETYLAAYASCLEGLRTGRTAVLDFMVGLPDIEQQRGVLRAFRDSGVRGFLGRATRELHHEAAHRDPWFIPLDDALDQITQLAGEYDNGLGVPAAGPAPGNPRTMTTRGLERVARYADEQGCQMTTHLAEYAHERTEGLERWGMSTIAKLEQIGFLGPRLVAAHCPQVDADELAILARSGTQVSYNPVSNCYVAAGIPPIVRMLELGIPVSLANDGAASNNTQDMIESLKVGSLLQKAVSDDPRAINARDMLHLATYGGARALGAPDRLGALEPGRLADLLLFDPARLNSAPAHDPISALVYTGSSENVTTVVADGRVVVENGALVGVDEVAVSRELEVRARAVAARTGAARNTRGRRRTPFRRYERSATAGRETPQIP